MGLPSIPLITSAGGTAPSGAGAADAARGGDAFASLFRGLSGPVKGTAAKHGNGSSDGLALLESLLGGMMQQPPPALAILFDQVQSALGAPPSAGTHASISSIAGRIDTLLASGTAPARIESTVSQVLAHAFAGLSASPNAQPDAAFVSRLQSSIASALDAAVPQTAAEPATDASLRAGGAAAVNALGPPAAGPPGVGPPAIQAAALAQRIAQLGAAIVAGADSGETGQQFRNLASTLDPSGKGLPAPQTQTTGELSPSVASSSSAASGAAATQTARLPLLQLPQSTGTPVRIDAHLAPLISLLAVARDGNASSQHGGGQQPQDGHASGSWLGALAGLQQANAAAPDAAAQAATPSQQAPAGNPTDPYQVVNQVAGALSVNPLSGAATMRIHLVPDHLGDVSVKLVVGPSGVSASFTAATPAAGAALQQGAPQLGRAFASHGLQLQQFSVNVGADPNGGFAHRQPQSFYAPLTHYSGASGTYGDEDPLAAIPSFGPPAALRPSGYLDYLV